MTTRRNADRRQERGFSLVEVLVATAVLVVVIVGALMLYDRANRVFKQSSEASEMQQNVRVAYDRMVADLRMAGFDYMRAGRVPMQVNAAAWGPNRPYSAGALVTPNPGNGRMYMAGNAGTSGGTQPTWPTSSGGTVNDNGITWRENGGAVYEQPDEQIEYAGRSAITVRANYDYTANETGDGDHGREPALERPQFPVVTTENDEIVTYALVSNRTTGTRNEDTITFYADVNNGGAPARVAYPGGGTERQITISQVDLDNDHPPYTLYRFTLNDAGAVVRTPLAENIRSLNFFYYEDTSGTMPLRDAVGTPPPNAPNFGGDGLYDPLNVAASLAPRQVRSRIRAVRVRLVGMHPETDPNYNDTSTAQGQLSTASETSTIVYSTATSAVLNPTFTADTIAPRNRKITLDTLIVPRNLGVTGIPQSQSQPPAAPTLTSLCAGYCGIVQVNWNPNTSSLNANYVILWDTSATGSFSNIINAGVTTSFAVDLTQQDRSSTTTYFFKVRAFNDAGSRDSTNVLSTTISNATQPNAPTNILISGGSVGGVAAQPGVIRLQWTAATTNAGGTAPTCVAPSGTPPSPTATTYLRETRGFRIYRGTTSNFTADATTMVASETSSGPNAPVGDGYGNFFWNDTNIIGCTYYYYRVQPVEWCANANIENTTNSTATSIGPITPANGSPALNGTTSATGTPRTADNFAVDSSTLPCNSGANTCTVRLTWTKVTQDTSGNPMSIDSYVLERERHAGAAVSGPIYSGDGSGGTTLDATLRVSGVAAQPSPTVVFTETVPHHDAGGTLYRYYYRVKAMQTTPCPNGAYTSQIEFPPPCVFAGTSIVQAGASEGDGLTAATAWVMNAGDTFQVTPPSGQTLVNTTMDVYDGSSFIGGTPNNSSPANFTWTDQSPGIVYRVVFTMLNNASPPCQEQIVRYVEQETPPGCTLRRQDEGNPQIFTQNSAYVFTLRLVNSAGEPLVLDEIQFVWNRPSTRIVWNNIKFPSGATYTIPNQNAAQTLDLTPPPAGVVVNDRTVPANGQLNLTINFGPNHPNPPAITTSILSSICVKYTRAGVPGQTFFCKILPGAGAGNPFTSCN